MADSAKSAAALALFEKICSQLDLEELEKGQEMILIGPAQLRELVREEVKNTGPDSGSEEALTERLWERLRDRTALEEFGAKGGDVADRVIRIIDRRIDQFLDRHLKSKEMSDRISGISKSEARLMFATSVERLKNEIESKVAQEVEKSIDDLLRSEALTDRIRKVAREAPPAQAAVSAASA